MATAVELDKKTLKEIARRERLSNLKKLRQLYLFIIIPVISLFIFHYMPIYGILIAFKKFNPTLGIWNSKWNSFAHFDRLFHDFMFARILRNTIIISLMRLGFGFPAPIILALLLNEVRTMGFKRVVQTITYLPHFLSWVVLSGIIMEVLSPQRGILAWMWGMFGKDAPNLLMDKNYFRPMLVVTGIWKEVGWGTVIYLAALAGIDPGLYESASIDGANRFQQAWRITVPSLVPVMTILFILNLGGILNAGFDQVFNMYNPLVYEVGDIIDTYVYRIGIVQRQYDFSTAVGLFKNLMGVILIIGTNAVIKRFTEYGIW